MAEISRYSINENQRIGRSTQDGVYEVIFLYQSTGLPLGLVTERPARFALNQLSCIIDGTCSEVFTLTLPTELVISPFFWVTISNDNYFIEYLFIFANDIEMMLFCLPQILRLIANIRDLEGVVACNA